MDKKKILILNGVNLSCLGTREVDIYGSENFQDYIAFLKSKYPMVELSYQQTNSLDVLVTMIENHKNFDGIILNPGAYTHTAIVIADAIKASPVPVVEVHISNLFGREQYRKNSLISASCKGFIAGFGLKGYELALSSFLN
ncbi:3-dehydroquinate dehydratase [Bacteroidales bacterium OttesenSCG-928-E04]|nr:3-dehydroquinate dehydratase [Bacteroidales bacterium OttesenSCG-928-E04]